MATAMARAVKAFRGQRVLAAGRRLTVIGILLLLGLTACSAARKDPPLAEGQPTDPCADHAHRQEVQALVAAREQPAGSDASYTVAPGDLLVVTVYNYRPAGGDFSSDVRVDDRGYISLPMMDPMHVAGSTVAEVRGAIIAGLRQAQVMNEPLVSVFLKDYQGQEIVVLGAVARPGMYHLSRGKQTLVDVLSMAGGLGQTAGNYALIRPGSEPQSADNDGVAQAYAIHTVAVKDPPAGIDAGNIPICFDTPGGEPDPALMMLQVHGGDLLIVPDAGQAYVEGEVSKPGPYPLTRGMTLSQLISSAGGFTFPADPNEVKLIRQVGTDHVEWQIDMKPSAGQTQADVRLTKNDRVIVPATAGRKVAYGIYDFVTAVVRVAVGGSVGLF